MAYYRPHELQELRKRLYILEDTEQARSEAIGIARDHGDLSENSDYDEAKDAQGQDEAKKKALRAKIESARDLKLKNNYTSVGSTIEVEKLDGYILTFTLTSQVDAGQTYFIFERDEKGEKIKDENGKSKIKKEIKGADVYLNVNSPLGSTYLNRTIGDELIKIIPRDGFDVWTIISISHDPNDDTLYEILPKEDAEGVKQLRDALVDEDAFGAMVNLAIQEKKKSIVSNPRKKPRSRRKKK